ncbi:uncharacterized protein LOC112589227 [Harpegnathos saltator]|uniref:uncharacterized protein LOC112589227 n=1 Tax=Harpegnathos saltator TaxID=610380 RepID=UPI000DBEDF6E|nr:uncharacterized protein LOC112589227 [Harpegnathos saltator]
MSTGAARAPVTFNARVAGCAGDINAALFHRSGKDAILTDAALKDPVQARAGPARRRGWQKTRPVPSSGLIGPSRLLFFSGQRCAIQLSTCDKIPDDLKSFAHIDVDRSNQRLKTVRE